MNNALLSGYLGYLRDCERARQRRSAFENIFRIKDAQVLGLTPAALSTLEIEEALEDERIEAHKMAVALELAGPLELTASLGLVYVVGRCELAARRDDDEEGDAPSSVISSGRRTTPLCAPLLTVPLMIERREKSVYILPEETGFTLNLGLVAKLADTDDEDLLHFHLTELLNRIPQWPLSAEGLKEFLLHVAKAFPKFPGLQPDLLQSLDLHEENLEEIAGARNQEPRLISTAAMFIHPPTPSLSVMGELEKLADRTDLGRSILGRTIREVGLPTLRQDGERAPQKVHEDAADATAAESLAPMDLSAMQESILKSARETDLTVVTGPPGTGKSYSITALILDHVQRGKTVLIASHKAQAVDIVVKNIQKFGSEDLVAVSGNRAAQRKLAADLDNLTDKDATRLRVSRSDMDMAEEELREAKEAFRKATQDADFLMNLMGQFSHHSEEAKTLAPVATNVVQNNRIKLSDAVRGSRLLEYGRSLTKDGDSSWLRKFRGRRYVNRVRESLKAPIEAGYRDLECGLSWVRHRKELEKVTQQLAPWPGLDEAWKKLEKAQARLLEAKRALLALQRRQQLYSLLVDDEARGQLRAFIGALRASDGNIKRKNEFLNRVDAKALLKAFPVWACTNPHVSSVLPLEAGMFDLVVIDEASQCDLTSAVPVLYRGKSAVVVGDPHQLTPVIFLNAKQEAAAFAKNEVSTGMRVTHRYSQRSLFDIVNDVASGRHKHMLDEHYRCAPPIIEFSNREFYGNALRIMTSRPDQRFEDAFTMHKVSGRREEDSTVNPAEVDCVINILKRLAEEKHDCPPSVGILSPFRDHAEALKRAVASRCPAELYTRHAVVIGTAHALQGDQRDIVILSTSLDPDFAHGTLRFLENPNLLNVAVTRARKHMHIVTSVSPEDLPDGLLKRYFLHAEQRLEPKKPTHDRFDSKFEEEACFDLRANGLTVFTQFKACGYEIDLVVTDGTAAVGVECDGPTHFRTDGSYTENDVVRHSILRRAGWPLVRIPYYEWNRGDRSSFIQEIQDCLVNERRSIDQLRGQGK